MDFVELYLVDIDVILVIYLLHVFFLPLIVKQEWLYHFLFKVLYF